MRPLGGSLPALLSLPGLPGPPPGSSGLLKSMLHQAILMLKPAAPYKPVTDLRAFKGFIRLSRALGALALNGLISPWAL